MTGIETIMVTTDFSDTSKAAFPLAREMADKFGAKIVMAYVEENRLPPLVVEYASVGMEDMVRQQQMRSAEQLAQVAREAFGDRVKDRQIRDGAAHVELVRLAEEIGADLIVMATHGRGFFTHAMLGSTTERVVRRAPCPVLVVREEKKP